MAADTSRVVPSCETAPMSDDSAPEELSAIEAARYRAAHSAGDEFRDAFVSGDPDERSAAAGQFLQALSQLDPEGTRDKLHVPDDAGEYRDALIAMMLRIPERWGRWIRCSKGWYPLITQLDAELAALDPNYELHQCKEKFATLHYYARTERDDVRDRFKALIRDAEQRSAVLCELCGSHGWPHASRTGWYRRTVCAACASADGYEPIGELVDELTPDRRGCWKVTTASSEHFWDLNAGTYTRIPGPRSSSGAMPGDRDSHRIVEVVAWPRVGSRSHVVFDGDATSGHWRISSCIERIERIR